MNGLCLSVLKFGTIERGEYVERASEVREEDDEALLLLLFFIVFFIFFSLNQTNL